LTNLRWVWHFVKALVLRKLLKFATLWAQVPNASVGHLAEIPPEAQSVGQQIVFGFVAFVEVSITAAVAA
jgi:hypothetical protein